MESSLLNKAQNGDIDARNKFIELNKHKIYRYSCIICKRFLKWENDDELSIALIAFNSAIDTYKKGSFSSYAKIVIKNRLIDYFRKNSKNSICIDIEDNKLNAVCTADTPLEDRIDKAAQIKMLSDILSGFNITFNDLTVKSPKHIDTRKNLLDMCKIIAKNDDIMNVLYDKHVLPSKEILLTYNASRKMLEKWRKYIIALLIIFNDNRLESIRSFIDSEER